jgi:hypothetical protein
MRWCLLGVLLACRLLHAPLTAQTVMPERTGVSETIRRRFPCPRQIPAAWTRADATLGQFPRCALVVAALQANERSTASIPFLPRVSLSQATCIRVRRITLRNPDSNRVVSDNWAVEFYSDGQPDVLVTLDPRTGTGHTNVSPRDFNYSTQELCAPAV